MVAALLVTAVSASAQRVFIRIPSNYEVSIDDRNYVNNETVNSIGYGQHTVKLFKQSTGIWGVIKRKVPVSTSSFEMRNNDVTIEADQYGQLRIYDSGYNNNQNGNGNNYPNNGGYGNQNGNGNNYPNNGGNGCQRGNGKGYGPYNNPGRGHKYGLYKKDHNKNERRDWNDNNDDDDHEHGNGNGKRN